MALDLSLGFSSRAASGRGFSPLNISGLSLWLDSSDANTFSLRASQYVAAWNDKSGNGNHFRQSILANQPEYQSNQQNGLATVKFDDVNQGYLRSDNDFITTDSDTWFFVFQSDGDGDANGTLLADYGDVSAKLLVFRADNDSAQDVFYARDGANNSLSILDTLTTAYSYMVATRIPGAITLDYNGNSQSASGTYLATLYNAGPFPHIGVQSGYPSGVIPNTQMKGHVAEILRYSRELNSGEKTVLETYLKEKWGL